MATKCLVHALPTDATPTTLEQTFMAFQVTPTTLEQAFMAFLVIGPTVYVPKNVPCLKSGLKRMTLRSFAALGITKTRQAMHACAKRIPATHVSVLVLEAGRILILTIHVNSYVTRGRERDFGSYSLLARTRSRESVYPQTCV